jgi:catechol 2,3-dioxygenase-like lactoylglutathione lyase family enzyme
MIKDIAFVAYAVSDVPRAVAFYRDVLGLEPGEPFNDQYVEFNVGSIAFAVDGSPPLAANPEPAAASTSRSTTSKPCAHASAAAAPT